MISSVGRPSRSIHFIWNALSPRRWKMTRYSIICGRPTYRKERRRGLLACMAQALKCASARTASLKLWRPCSKLCAQSNHAWQGLTIGLMTYPTLWPCWDRILSPVVSFANHPTPKWFWGCGLGSASNRRLRPAHKFIIKSKGAFRL